MKFTRNDRAYISENGEAVAVRIISHQDHHFMVSRYGVCGVIKVPDTQVFETEEEALHFPPKPTVSLDL